MQEVFHNKQLDAFSSVFSDIRSEEVFLVRGGKSYIVSGAEQFVNQFFRGERLTAFSDFDVNPNLTDLQKGLELFRKGSYKKIVAIGGGSVIDMAKLISAFALQEKNPEKVIKGEQQLEGFMVPVLAIPTTAGTGAEATHFAVVYIDKIKYSLAHHLMLPETVYLSAEFSQNADGYLTACTGLDAFCQAVESIWCVNASSESMKYASEAVQLCFNNLPAAVLENNKSSKDAMQWAAYLAGKAINLTKTTAPHAISYPFTSYYNIPHGHAVALSLPFFFDYNYQVNDSDCSDRRGAKEVKKRMGVIAEILGVNVGEVSSTIETFYQKLRVKTELHQLTENFSEELILQNINTERLGNNPRKVTQELVSKFLKTIA